MVQLTPSTTNRLVREFKQLKKEKHEFIQIMPDKKNLLLWYFIIRGPDNTDYAGGYYVGRIMHDKEYPNKPPHFRIHTPNGRFTINQNICLTITGYHADQWSPTWTMSRAIDAFMSIMLADVDDGISHIKRSPQERRKLAYESVQYNKNNLMDIITRFDRFINSNGDIIPLKINNLDELTNKTYELYINNNILTDDDVEKLCSYLGKKSSLTTLKLNSHNLSTEQFEKLCNVLSKNKTLQVLDLTDNIITEHNLNLIKKMLLKNFTLINILGVDDINDYLTGTYRREAKQKSKKRSKKKSKKLNK